MNVRLSRRALACVAVLAAAGCAQQPATPPLAKSAVAPAVAPIPLRDFFRNPQVAGHDVSDDGKWLAFLQTAPGEGGTPRMNVFVQPLDGVKPTGTPRQLTRSGARDIRRFHWKGNRSVLYAMDNGGDENFHVVAADVATGTVRDLTPGDKVRAMLIDDLQDDPRHVLVQHNRRDAKVFDVVRLDVETGTETLVARNPGNIDGWLTDHQGRVRIAGETDGVNKAVLYRDDEAQPLRPIIRTDFRTSVYPVAFHADGKRFYAISNRGRDLAGLVLIDPARPDDEQVVAQAPRVDVTGLRFSRNRKVPLEVSYEDGKPARIALDDEARRLRERLAAKLPAGLEIDIAGHDRAENLYVVRTRSDRMPGHVYLYRASDGALADLGTTRPWLDGKPLAEMKPVTYTARDGLTIPAYLTLPPGRDAKNLACIVNPHGGPWARDSWGYNPEVQFLANRGYCVLQMNFRGSTGYGRTFWEASFRQWGRAMQDDVSDGAKWLVAQGIADPKRIGIYGGSYGGYATLAGITFTPDLYAAAVDYVGVSNLFTFMKTIPPYWESFRQQMYAMVGNPDDPKDAAMMRAASPVFHVDRIRTPLLVAQGAKDPRVNIAESDQIVEALKKRGVDVQYIVKANEGHGFSNEENRFEFYEAMESFFGKHLKP